MAGEQWIEGGDCDICRRQSYCHKECKQRVLFERRRAFELANSLVAKMYVEHAKKVRGIEQGKREY